MVAIASEVPSVEHALKRGNQEAQRLRHPEWESETWTQTMRSADPAWAQPGGARAADGSELPALPEPDDHADLDEALLPLAVEFGEGSAGDFLERVKARYDVDRWSSRAGSGLPRTRARRRVGP